MLEEGSESLDNIFFLALPLPHSRSLDSASALLKLSVPFYIMRMPSFAEALDTGHGGAGPVEIPLLLLAAFALPTSLNAEGPGLS